MKTATAKTIVEVNVYCPHCGDGNDIFEYDAPTFDLVRDEFNFRGEMRSDNCEIEVQCDTCKEHFLVTTIEF